MTATIREIRPKVRQCEAFGEERRCQRTGKLRASLRIRRFKPEVYRTLHLCWQHEKLRKVFTEGGDCWYLPPVRSIPA